MTDTANERTRQIYETAGRIVHRFATGIDDPVPPQLRSTASGRALADMRATIRRGWDVARAKWGGGEYSAAANMMAELANTIRTVLASVERNSRTEGDTAARAAWSAFWRLSGVGTAVSFVRTQGTVLDRLLAYGAAVTTAAAGGLGIVLGVVAVGAVLYFARGK